MARTGGRQFRLQVRVVSIMDIAIPNQRASNATSCGNDYPTKRFVNPPESVLSDGFTFTDAPRPRAGRLQV